jgi:GrpB-like predicted nucleotidyltransferase (UPF0157 family)/ligand-binding SRPBCC domain-containing protein
MHFNTDIWLPRPRDEVFQFFSNAANLEALTPPWLHFEILTPGVALRSGARIDYRLRLYGIPFRWQSEISRWEPPHRFVDEQRRGPYRRWVHTHTFTDERGGTLVADAVDFEVRFAWLTGALVMRDVRRIFAFRTEVLVKRFGPSTRHVSDERGGSLRTGVSTPAGAARSGDEHLLRGDPVPIQIVDYDPHWPELFTQAAASIRAALGARALRLEHAGSTSVPGLAAKPVVDIVLAVADSADEPSYLPALDAAGYALRIREAEWYEHRLLEGTIDGRSINLHVFSDGCPEIARMLRFRDWLRENPGDRALYERTKRDLARKTWNRVQDYADAKTQVVEEIIARVHQR